MGLKPSKIAQGDRPQPAGHFAAAAPAAQGGLISVRKGFVDGRTVIYFIDPRQLGRITAWLAGTEVGRAFPPTPRDELV